MTITTDIVDLVLSYVDCSLDNRRDELGKLEACGVDKPEVIVTIATNCGMFMRGILHALGVHHHVLDNPYVSQHAISDLITIGTDTKTLKKYVGHPETIPVGSIIFYNTAGTNNWHVTCLTSQMNNKGIGTTAGGGGARNHIGVSTGNVSVSWGRPIVQYIDVALLLSLQKPQQQYDLSFVATVTGVQQALNLLHVAGTPLVVDGDLGPMTKAVIMTFQRAHGLVVDGVAGPKTKDALIAALNSQ